MVPRMAYLEFCRLVTRARLWVFVALVSGYGIAASWYEVPAVAAGASVRPSTELTLAVALQTLWLLTIGISLVAGGTLADDRRSGYLLLQLSRGVTSSQVVVSRLCAAAAVGCLSVLAAGGALGLYASFAAAGGADGPADAVSFAPQLLSTSLVGYLMLVATINGIAASALLSCSLMIGVLTPAKFLSEMAPPLGVLLLGFVMSGPLWALNPLERASFMQFSGVAWATPRSMLLYWGSIVAAASFGAVSLSRRMWGGQ